MRFYFMLLFLGCITFQSSAQMSFGRGRAIDITNYDAAIFFAQTRGANLPLDRYVKTVEGTPYLTQGWMKSNFVYEDEPGRHIMMRLDLVNNELHFQDAEGREQLAVTRIKELYLVDTQHQVQYHFVHSSAIPTSHKKINAWYQQVIAGKASLYKFYNKQIFESLPYGQATYEQRIATVPQYFVLKDEVLTRVKKFKDLEDILYDKPKEIQAAIKKSGAKEKTDDDYYDIITYYNSLFK
ncbi:hypothetical protein [Aridibaculum aurantiacum]|uniref:hypothetical protein n=1 Tax=Aridibaculum aurantiacum TaxID=2810307 RepID=UPI001A959C91|nr:hypothetical protein [Aridibaculum aurantiacum]